MRNLIFALIGLFALPAGAQQASERLPARYLDLQCAICGVSSGDGSSITLTVPLLLPDGSGAAPSLTFASDTDTGISLASADSMRLGAGGNSVVFIEPGAMEMSGNRDFILKGGHAYDSTKALALGTDCAAAGTTGNVCTGGTLTVDDDVNIDSNLYFNGGAAKIQNNGAAAGITVQTLDNNAATITGSIVIESGFQGSTSDIDSGAITLASGSTNTDGKSGDIILFSGKSGDGEHGTIKTGIGGPGAAQNVIGSGLATVTFSGGGDASQTATGFRVAQRKILGVSGRVVTTGTTCTSMDIGDGSDVDRYGAGIAITDGTVFDIDDATADPEEFLTGAGDVVITANGGNCVDLVVNLTLHWRGYQAATVD